MSSESTLCAELLLDVALDTEETLLTLRDLHAQACLHRGPSPRPDSCSQGRGTHPARDVGGSGHSIGAAQGGDAHVAVARPSCSQATVLLAGQGHTADCDQELDTHPGGGAQQRADMGHSASRRGARQPNGPLRRRRTWPISWALTAQAPQGLPPSEKTGSTAS